MVFLVLSVSAALMTLSLWRQKIRAERALAQQTAIAAARDLAVAHFRTMIDEASDIIVLWENGRAVYASNGLYRELKHKPEQYQEGGYLNFVHPEDLHEAQKLLGRPPPGVTRTGTYRVRHTDGNYIWFEVYTRGIYDEVTGAFRQEISVGRNITERKEHEFKMRAAQERAEAANKAKSQFLATMSHELRTPLNAILGFSDILKAEQFGALGNARYREYSTAIHGSGIHLLGLINDILDMSKLDEGRLELQLEPVELHALIADCLLSIRPHAEKAGIQVYEALDPGIDVLQADAKRLRQMLLNLLSNAVKFTPKGGEVRLSTRRQNGGVAITVADTGIGMDADAIPKAFERFGQIDSSLARKYEGTGLGLPLTKQLAELHGASLSVESTPGAGTAMTIFFSGAVAQISRHVA
ncbi:MAG: PAS domain-containing sensor histidine kinase [Candidatus Sulfotelmatobacter sp.]